MRRSASGSSAPSGTKRTPSALERGLWLAGHGLRQRRRRPPGRSRARPGRVAGRHLLARRHPQGRVRADESAAVLGRYRDGRAVDAALAAVRGVVGRLFRPHAGDDPRRPGRRLPELLDPVPGQGRLRCRPRGQLLLLGHRPRLRLSGHGPGHDRHRHRRPRRRRGRGSGFWPGRCGATAGSTIISMAMGRASSPSTATIRSGSSWP